MTPLSYDFMQRAFVACVLVCAAAPLVGAFVVQRRQSLIGDGIGHVAFAGVGLAFLVGVSPLLGALALTLVAVVALQRLSRAGLGGDVALALVFYGGISLGYLLSSRSDAGVGAVLGFLFGSALDLTWGEVGVIALLAGIVVAIVALLYLPLVAIAFDEAAARVSGVPTSGLTLALTAVVGLVVVGGMYALGLLLVAAMMVVPVAAAAQVARSYRQALLLASAIGALSAVVGLLLAFYADTTPGASIVVVAIGCYGVTAVLRAVPRRAIRTTTLESRQ